MLRVQAQASQIAIKFQWLVRPPASARLKSEYKNGTDTILSFVVSPQSFEEYEQDGLLISSILDSMMYQSLFFNRISDLEEIKDYLIQFFKI